MSDRFAASLAWMVWVLAMAFVGLGLLFMFLNGNVEHLLDESLGVDAAVAVAFPTVGAVVASRRTGNAIGWIFCAVGFFGGAAVFLSEYGIYALVTKPGSLPAGVAAAWISTWIWVPSVSLTTTFLLLLFPHGRLLSPRWRSVAWLAAATTVVGVGVIAILPWEKLEPGVPGDNPFEVGVRDPILLAVGISALALLLGSALLSVLSLFLRFRRSRGVERQQLKWFVYAAVLVVATFLPGPSGALADVATFLQILIFPLLAAAAGVAIFRYHLYDIDVVINRTLVYGALTATLALIYVGGIVALQYVFRALTGQESQLAIVASTLAVAALFNPLRRRIQDVVDRRFYRSKYDAAKTLSAFGAKLREETDLKGLDQDLVGVVVETVQPAHIRLWLRPLARSREEGR